MSNKSFMCILRNQGGGCNDEPSSPSEMEAMYAKYQKWQEKYAENIIDMGSALGSTGAVVKADGVSDGPFVEVKEVVGGFMTIRAADLAEAVGVIQNSPMMENEGVSIELREMTKP